MMITFGILLYVVCGVLFVIGSQWHPEYHFRKEVRSSALLCFVFWWLILPIGLMQLEWPDTPWGRWLHTLGRNKDE